MDAMNRDGNVYIDFGELRHIAHYVAIMCSNWIFVPVLFHFVLEGYKMQATSSKL